MKIRLFVLSLAVLFCHFTALSQPAVIAGRVVAKQNHHPLAGAHVRLIELNDSTQWAITATDSSGHFVLPNVPQAIYILEITYIGYGKHIREITVDNRRVDLDEITLSVEAIPVTEVVVEGHMPAAELHGDTTVYNAGAFKVNADASGEDMVKKMPGVVIEDGTVKAQGEDVKQILVDGQQFFGSDPMLALKNLPADMIDQVQVFDKAGDQAQLTGFNDGQTIKTMNIVTKSDCRRGQFGRASGGVGSDDRYSAGGTMNHFDVSRRVSIIGLSNNANRQNFSMEDILGVFSTGDRPGGRGGGGMFGGGGSPGGGSASGESESGPPPPGGGAASTFFVGQQSGTSVVHSFGLNYADSVTHRLYATGSYFFNRTDNANPRNLLRHYIDAVDSGSVYAESNDTRQNNNNHRVNIRLEFAPDSSNTLIAAPQISFQGSQISSRILSSALLPAGAAASGSESDSRTNASGYNFTGRFVYRHKFPATGRTISAAMDLGRNRQESSGNQYSLEQFFSGEARSDTLAQVSSVLMTGRSLSADLSYAEPLGHRSLLQFSAGRSNSHSASDNGTYNRGRLDSALSNSYENEYRTENAGLGYFYRGNSFFTTAGVSYQRADLLGTQSFPYSSTLERTFSSVLPYAMLNYQISKHRDVHIFYRTSTTAPSVTQLQDVVNNSNPLILTAGNPELRQSYSHSIMSRLAVVNPLSAQSLMVFLMLNTTKDYIGSSTVTAQRDTVLDGIAMIRGVQITRPVNLDGYWNIRTMWTYSLPFDILSSNLNVNAGAGYARTPGLVNNQRAVTGVFSLSPGFMLASNIGEDLDFTLSYTASLSLSCNSLQNGLNNNYWMHAPGLTLTWIPLEGIVLQTDMTGVLYAGLTPGVNTGTLNWNISVGKKVFANQRGEFLLTVYDVLNENTKTSRTITGAYYEDSETSALPRYIMLTFNYNLGMF